MIKIQLNATKFGFNIILINIDLQLPIFFFLLHLIFFKNIMATDSGGRFISPGLVSSETVAYHMDSTPVLSTDQSIVQIIYRFTGK